MKKALLAAALLAGFAGVAHAQDSQDSITVFGIDNAPASWASFAHPQQPYAATAAGDGQGLRLSDIGLSYRRGPWQGVVSYAYGVNDNNMAGLAPANRDFTSLTLGGNYDFGVASMFGGVQQGWSLYNPLSLTSGIDAIPHANYALGAPGLGSAYPFEDRTYTLGLSAPLGFGGKALLAYQRATASRTDGLNLGYVYSLTKRTNLYGFYSLGRIGNAGLSNAGPSRFGDTGVSQQFSLGVSTRF